VLSGIVLAGGAGSRLGQPKATVVLGGRTLVEHAVDALRSLCEDVIVVGRPEVDLPELAVRVVHDRAGPDCPLNALATGLGAVTGDDVLVLACDMPNAEPVLRRLVAAEPAGALVAVDDAGRLQPLCARYPRVEALAGAELLLAAGERRMHALVERLGASTLPATRRELANINTRDDLAAQVRSLPMGEPLDPAVVHRDLAMTTFNRSWDLIGTATRDGEAEAELLGLVFTSWWHWHQVGTSENKALADHHVAKALALVGDGTLSLRFAQRAMDACVADGWADWKLVACHEGMARAYAALGDHSEKDRHLRAAAEGLHDLDDEDAAVLVPQLEEIPGWPPG
jgi:molybdopterin-guanine dinucleotide biosynthesis protein A